MAGNSAGTVGNDGAQAIRRWKLGHHVFHIHLAVMNSLLLEAQERVRESDWENLDQVLAQLTVLYDAATASMKYAADFDQLHYESLVRPSMSPPFVSPGFSGTLNLEHELMLVRLRNLRRLLRPLMQQPDLPDAIRQGVDGLTAAQARNQHHHKLVCESFVPGGTSLLRDHFGHD